MGSDVSLDLAQTEGLEYRGELGRVGKLCVHELGHTWVIGALVKLAVCGHCVITEARCIQIIGRFTACPCGTLCIQPRTARR